MSFLTILRKARLREHEARVLLLGLDNAGKTTVLYRLLGESLTDVSPTLGFEIRTVQRAVPHVEGAQGSGPDTISMNVWDVGGQTSLRSYWRNYFESTDAIVWVVDAADGARVTDSEHELCLLTLLSHAFDRFTISNDHNVQWTNISEVAAGRQAHWTGSSDSHQQNWFVAVPTHIPPSPTHFVTLMERTQICTATKRHARQQQHGCNRLQTQRRHGGTAMWRSAVLRRTLASRRRLTGSRLSWPHVFSRFEPTN